MEEVLALLKTASSREEQQGGDDVDSSGATPASRAHDKSRDEMELRDVEEVDFEEGASQDPAASLPHSRPEDEAAVTVAAGGTDEAQEEWMNDVSKFEKLNDDAELLFCCSRVRRTTNLQKRN